MSTRSGFMHPTGLQGRFRGIRWILMSFQFVSSHSCRFQLLHVISSCMRRAPMGVSLDTQTFRSSVASHSIVVGRVTERPIPMAVLLKASVPIWKPCRDGHSLSSMAAIVVDSGSESDIQSDALSAQAVVASFQGLGRDGAEIDDGDCGEGVSSEAEVSVSVSDMELDVALRT